MRRMLVVILSCAGWLAGGCPPEDYSNLVPLTQAEITRIVNDENLNPQEQRLQLEALGVSPLTINALLRDKPLGNQFGGDLRTAYQKVIEANLQALTPDEIQIYAAQVASVDSTLGANFSDAQAQDIVDFLADSDLSSAEELATFLAQSPEFVPSSVTADDLQNVFVEFVPSLLLPVLP